MTLFINFKYKRTHQSHGFALVIALSLMAFILLLLLSLTTFIRVESQSSEIRQDVLSARMDALLGIQVGLGRLQSSAGPDQRVTAIGQLLTDTDLTKAQYTGVWDADPDSATYGEVLDWLASRSDQSTFNLANDNTLATDANWPILVEARKVGTADEVAEVRAEFVDIQGQGNAVDGRFAFWIGDESVKARVDLENQTTVDPVGRVLGERSSIELGMSGDARSAYEGALSSGTLSKLGGMAQFPLLGTSAAEKDALKELSFDSFHELTTHSVGLMTNTREGGLKHDLTVLFESDDSTFEDSAVTALLATDPTTSAVDPLLVTTNQPDALAVAHLFAAVHEDFIGDERVPGPTFNVLRDYYRLYQVVDDTAAAQIAPRRALPRPSGDDITKGFRNVFSNVHVGDWHTRTRSGNAVIWPRTNKIHPVITEARYFLSLRKMPNPNEVPADPDDDYELQLVIDPIFTIWNPYNIDLDLTNYAMTFHMKGMPVKITIVIDKNDDGNLDGPGVDDHYDTFLVDLMGAGGSQTSYRCAFSGGVLPAGQVDSYSPNNASPLPQTVDLDLEAGWNQAGGYYAERIASNGSPGNPGGYSRLVGPEGMSGWIMVNYEGNATDRSFRVRNFLIDDVSRRFDTNLGSSEPYTFEVAGYDMNVVKFRNKDSPQIGQIPFNLDSNPPISIGSGDKVFFAEVDMHINAEDEIDVPLGQMSVMAYTSEGRLGLINQSPEYPAIPLQQIDVKELSSLAQVDGRFGSSRVAGGQKQVVMFDVPRGPLQSIAQLQDVDFTVYGTQPMHAIGNSYASAIVPKNEKIFKYSMPDETSSETLTVYQIDTSFYTNEALWDKYFFSTLTDADSNTTQTAGDPSLFELFLADSSSNKLPNPRMVSIDPSGDITAATSEVFNSTDGYQNVGKYLGVKGAFNINSTSQEAWEAILASTRGKTSAGESDFRHFTDGTTSSSDTAFSWNEFRSLSDANVSALASKIVELIRSRARPFLSLSDFVNRELGTGANENNAGILQRAIDEVGLNSGFVQTSTLESGGDFGVFISSNSDGMKSAIGASTYLSQADVLSAIGSFITPRSDTFVIRSSGQHLDPLTGIPQASAYCEAIVQRVPTGALAEDRTFKVISLRWLKADEVSGI